MKPGSSQVQKKATEWSATQDITCKVYTAFEELIGMRKEWDSFVESVDGDIYLTFDWCRIWWKYYGGERKLRVFVFRKNDEVVGIIPLYVMSFGLGVFRLRIAKLLGADSTMEIMNPPFLLEYSGAILESVHKHIMETLCCDAICWGPLSAFDQRAEVLKKWLAGRGKDYGIIKSTAVGCYSFYKLPDTIDLYMKSLGKSTRKHFRSNYRNLTSEHDVDFAAAEGNEDNFFEFVRMHELQWKGHNKLGHFGDWPQAMEFHRDLAESGFRLERLRLFCLRVDAVPVVYRYVYRFGKRYYSLLPARSCGPDWDKYGLGQIAHILTAQKAIEEGVQEIDAGRGHYDHKLRLGGQEYPITSILVSKSAWRSMIRIRLFCLFSRTLDIWYCRVWFGRIAPRLPLKRRSLWKVWILTRL